MTTTATTHRCDECGTEYASFGTYTRTDECRKARMAAKAEAALAKHGEVPFGEEDAATVEATGSQYGHNVEAAMRKADAPEPRTGGNQYGPYQMRQASDKQIAFAKRLLAERPSYTWTTPVEHLDRRQLSRLIDDLLKTAAEVVSPTNLATEKQVAFAASLWAERMTVEAPDFAAMGKGQISELINTLKATPKPSVSASPKAEAVLVKGDVHVVDGEYYRVHTAQSTGNLYAARFTGHRFEYERGAIRRLTPENKITAEQAAEFGGMYNACCFCSKALDTPESTEVGYGPVCATKHGLPWGNH